MSEHVKTTFSSVDPNTSSNAVYVLPGICEHVKGHQTDNPYQRRDQGKPVLTVWGAMARIHKRQYLQNMMNDGM